MRVAQGFGMTMSPISAGEQVLLAVGSIPFALTALLFLFA